MQQKGQVHSKAATDGEQPNIFLPQVLEPMLPPFPLAPEPSPESSYLFSSLSRGPSWSRASRNSKLPLGKGEKKHSGRRIKQAPGSSIN